MRVRLLWLVGPSLLVAALPAWGQGCPQATCWVSTTGSDITGSGSSASPFRTIQRAIDETVGGDTVRVRPGTYNECVTAFFVDGGGNPIPSNISILADDYETAQRNTTTIIDGTGVCDPLTTPGPVVTVGDDTLLRGFTVRGGGNSGIEAYGHVTISRNVIQGNVGSNGGGIFLYTGFYVSTLNSTATIDNNRIADNTASDRGGGLFVFGVGSDGFPSDVVVTQNTISGNQVGVTGSVSYGGGLGVLTYAVYPGDESSVVISRNVIDGNSSFATSGGYASYGGGAFVTTYGFGVETIDVNDSNQIRNNDADGYGGGVAAWGFGAPDADHLVTVEANSVSANAASLGGGGVYLLTYAADLTPTTRTDVLAQDNEITGNLTNGPLGASGVTGGGGLYGEIYNIRTNSPDVVVGAERNILSGNSSASFGGGASLLSIAFSEDPFTGGAILEATSKHRFANNLVVDNGAIDPISFLGEGGGVYALAYAFGLATAEIETTFNTVAQNQVDPGGAGGVALDALTDFDVANNLGTATVSGKNSILAFNEQLGYGGQALPGFDNVTVDLRYNDVFGHIAGNYGPFTGDLTGQFGNISVDPELSATYVPPLCSPTIDAADPLAGSFDPSGMLEDEPQPNGRRANMGHLGLTAAAVRTLPDITGDGLVDGVDVLRIATSFGSLSSNAARFIAAADRDGDGQITGDDLSYVAAFFGTSCP